MANITTIMCDRFDALPSPKRVLIHSAPVITFDRLSQAERNTIRTIWLKTGHNQGIQMLLRP